MNLDDALCAQIGTELFFPENNIPRSRLAKKICLSCPITIDCLKFALSIEQAHDHGVWGATTARERVALRKDPEVLEERIRQIKAAQVPCTDNSLSNVA